jgi:serine protease Do/serine protease DegQ
MEHVRRAPWAAITQPPAFGFVVGRIFNEYECISMRFSPISDWPSPFIAETIIHIRGLIGFLTRLSIASILRNWTPPVFYCATALLTATSAWAAIPPLASDGRPLSLAPLIEQITPAVVNIAVLQRSPEQDNPMLQDPFFRRFFGLPESSRPQMSAGSGVIVDAKQGYVITNHHVVRDAQQIVVTLKDARRLQAKLLGSDAGTDVALLKVEPENLKALPFGDSDGLRVGDYVLAIGNPFGLGQTVTSGIVSALGRTGLNIEGYEDFIQTDASINPGNSGGALVDLKGNLIGINTAIIGPSGGNVGIGFAVPSNIVRAVTAQLIRYGEVRRGRVGLSTQDVSADSSKTLKVPANQGAVVVEVTAGAPADRAGMRVGDVVTVVNGRRVRSSSDLRNQIGMTPIGEEVEFKVLREGSERVFRMKVEPLRTAETTGGESVRELTGATVSNAERDGKSEAVAVTKVAPGTAAWSHGLRPGDVIVAVNRKKVRTTRELIEALGASGPMVLSVVRGDYLFTVVLRSS